MFSQSRRECLRRVSLAAGVKCAAATGSSRTIDAKATSVRKQYETEVEEVERPRYAAISRWRFEEVDRHVAPDATLTLRLAFGVVRGCAEEGRPIPFFTTLDGAFERAVKQGHRDPFELAGRRRENKNMFYLETPFNVVSTTDTIGSNSGSPGRNRQSKLVGINVARNRHGFIGNFVYTDVMARHIAVHSRGVLEALRKLYDCEPLVKELLNRE